MKSKHYRFISSWSFSAPPTQVWEALVDPHVWPKWWPSLDEVMPLHGAKDRAGSQTEAIFRAPLGYRLHLTLTINHLDYLKLITFDSAGDLAGDGDMQMSSLGGVTHVTIHWNVVTTKPWMNRFAFILGPAFRSSHAYVMRLGCAGLKRYLSR